MNELTEREAWEKFTEHFMTTLFMLQSEFLMLKRKLMKLCHC